ncbi:hypothetical protein S83_070310, partial [Arachis hypogaea]
MLIEVETLLLQSPEYLVCIVIMMRNGEVQLHARKLRSLVDLCVQKIIDNIRYLGNVGCVDLHLLERISPHYTGADLSPMTDKLWKGFFEKQYRSKIAPRKDGVSEGQFSQVLLHEMDAIRQACASLQAGYQPKKQRWW